MQAAKQWMCENFFDVRAFGAVMSTGVNAGQVRGPLQLTFGRSIDPILGLDAAITRVALTNPDPKQDADDESARSGTMGAQSLHPLWSLCGSRLLRPEFCREHGALTTRTWDFSGKHSSTCGTFDRSASKGLTSCRGLYVFSHDSKLGSAPAHKLLDRIRVERKDGVTVARAFSDYIVTIDRENLPNGVELHILTEG